VLACGGPVQGGFTTFGSLALAKAPAATPRPATPSSTLARATTAPRPLHPRLQRAELAIVGMRAAKRQQVVRARVGVDAAQARFGVGSDLIAVGFVGEPAQIWLGLAIGVAPRIEGIDGDVGSVRRANDRLERRQILQPAAVIGAADAVGRDNQRLAPIGQAAEMDGERVDAESAT
jgi:hypothetical protein